jgi:urocanate hydratase
MVTLSSASVYTFMMLRHSCVGLGEWNMRRSRSVIYVDGAEVLYRRLLRVLFMDTRLCSSS